MAAAYRDADSTCPAHGAVAVKQSDVTVIPVTRGLYVGVTGNLVVTMADGQTPITFTAAAVGYHPLQVTQVLTATTATDIVALY